MDGAPGAPSLLCDALPCLAGFARVEHVLLGSLG
jgi:hypothetical protein